MQPYISKLGCTITMVIADMIRASSQFVEAVQFIGRPPREPPHHGGMNSKWREGFAQVVFSGVIPCAVCPVSLNSIAG